MQAQSTHHLYADSNNNYSNIYLQQYKKYSPGYIGRNLQIEPRENRCTLLQIYFAVDKHKEMSVFTTRLFKND